MGKKKEQRKHKRFQVPKGAFVAVAPDYDKIGPLADLTMEGLAFCYIGEGEPPDKSHLDIFLTEGDFFLGKVPFRTISGVDLVDKVPSSPVTMKQCRVKFRKLTPDQKMKLNDFIDSHTEDEV
ncbi:MAG: hypothetical protein JSV01_02805 [Desulfobacterales bacterium]|nr:MAG: hypothetical protein JSV01_02805 [Desulfobacterales bacterium]UCG80938.1 MAG: hypothetical protein JSV60_01245 [Desulfobacterales bacterium]